MSRVRGWIDALKSYDLRGDTARKMIQTLEANIDLLDLIAATRFHHAYHPSPPANGTAKAWLNILWDQIENYREFNTYRDGQSFDHPMVDFHWFLHNRYEIIETIYNFHRLQQRFKG